VAGYQTSPGGPATRQPPVSQGCPGAEVGGGESVTGDTGFTCQETAGFVLCISATSFIPAISLARLGALGGKENQESLSIGAYASLDKAELADGSASGDSNMAQPLLGDTGPLQRRAGPVLTLWSGCMVDVSQKYMLPG